MSADNLYLDQLINNQRHAIKYYLVFGAGIFSIGLVIIAVSLIWPGIIIDGKFNILVGIGGGFVSSLSGFQVKEFLNRKEKVGMLITLKHRMAKLREEQSVEQAEKEQIQGLLWKLVEKTAME